MEVSYTFRDHQGCQRSGVCSLAICPSLRDVWACSVLVSVKGGVGGCARGVRVCERVCVCVCKYMCI